MITTRIYKPSDYKKVLRFMKKVDRDFKPPISEREGGVERYFEEILKKKHRIYVLEDHRFLTFFPKIVGLVMTYKKEKDKRVIKYIAIDEEYRKYGHGRAMIETALHDIRKSKEVLLRTWSTNIGALSLYTKMGFKFHRSVRDKDRGGEDKSIYMKLEEDDLRELKAKGST